MPKTKKTTIYIFPLIITIIIIIQIFQIIYFQRAYFFDSFNNNYWKDRYEHSQYQLPLSNRIIGDDGLYAYASFRLINGDDPLTINADKAPLGKYILGFSIILFNNPIISSLLSGIGTLILLYLLSKKLFLNTTQSLIITAIFSLDAMFFSQLWITGLDIIQLFWLLFSLYLLFHWYRSQRDEIIVLLLCGTTLGFFSEVKPPILLLIIIPTYLAWIIIKKKKIISIVMAYGTWGIGFIFGILLPYIWYLHLGHSIIDVAKIHKYMFAYYQSSTLPVHIGASIQALLLGKFPNITSNTPILIQEWWIIWVVISFVSALAALDTLKKKLKQDSLLIGLIIILIFSMILYCFIPFYPRYLLLLLPLFYIVSLQYVFRYIPRILLMFAISTIFLYGLFRTTVYMRPSPEQLLSLCLYSYTHQFFQDIYEECLDNESQKQISSDIFRQLTQKSLKDAEIVDITTRILKLTIDSHKQSGLAEVEFTYKTMHLGPFTEIKNIPLILDNNQWRIKWNWNILLNDFLPTYRVSTKIKNGKRGSIFDNKGTVLVYDTLGYRILVNPSLMDTKREEELLSILSTISSISRDRLHNQYLENPLPNESISLFTLFEPLPFDKEVILRSFPGVILMPDHIRMYTGKIGSSDIRNTIYLECCTKIYSSFNYHGVGGADYGNDLILSGFDGGELLILNENNSIIRTIIQKDPKNGIDIVVP